MAREEWVRTSLVVHFPLHQPSVERVLWGIYTLPRVTQLLIALPQFIS